MTRRRVVLAGALLGAAGLWFSGAGRGTTRADSAHEAAAVTSEELAPIQTPHELEAAARPQVSPAPPAAADPTPRPRVKKEDDPNQPFAIAGETDQDRAERAAERAELDKRWQGEAPDAAWANDSGPRIAKVLADARQPPQALHAVDCRQSICRFELHSAGGTQGEVMALIHAARQLELETWVRPAQQPDGSWHMETFFPKQGYRLSGGGGRIGQVKQVPDSSDLPRQPSTEEG
jgi:hypothetical protein